MFYPNIALRLVLKSSLGAGNEEGQNAGEE
jgi:hypothetical protein